MLIFSASAFAQSSYPHKSVYEIQYRPDDSLAAKKDRSSYTPFTIDASGKANLIGKDTLEIVGVVVVPPRLPDGRRTFGTSLLNSNNNPAGTSTVAATVFTVMDTSALRTKETGFQYIFVNNVDSSVSNKLGTGTLQRGDIVKLIGRVEENTNMTKFKLIDQFTIDGQPSYTGIAEVIGSVDEADMPAPPSVSITDFNTGSYNTADPSTKNFITGEYYEGARVKMTNLKVGNLVKTNGETETYVNDGNGNTFVIDNYSTYFASPNNKKFAPTNATIDSIFGTIAIFNGTGMWTINPATPADIFIAENIVPVVNSFEKNKVYYSPSDDINLKYFISDADGTVDTAWVYYRVNETGNFSKIQMTKNASDFTVNIPAINSDSALVELYVLAKDNLGGLGRYPINKYHGVWVLNHEPTIQVLQYSTDALGSSFFVGDSVSITGTVTSTMKDLGEVTIQNGTGPWSGILVYSPSKLDTFRLGDKVWIRGKVSEFSDKTEISYPNPSQMKILETHADYYDRIAAVPPATLVYADSVKTGGPWAEAFESVFVKLENAFVINTDVETYFVDNKSFGEIAINEDSQKAEGLRVDDIANVRNHNLPYINTVNITGNPLNKYDSTKTLYAKGQKFDELRGILNFLNFNFKLTPRDSTDFGFSVVTSVKNEGKPTSVSLDQNYPNPFNPSTTIRFSLNETKTVRLDVFNILGQKIATLVNGQLLAPKSYSFQFDGRNFSSGVYFYKLVVDDKTVQTKKMTLIK